MLKDALKVGLTVDQFWDLTPNELNLTMMAHSKKERAIMQKLAWHAANIMNVMIKAWGKRSSRPVRVKDLLGESKPRRAFASTEQMDSAALAHNRKLKGGKHA